jgi:hypothetical protein
MVIDIDKHKSIATRVSHSRQLHVTNDKSESTITKKPTTSTQKVQHPATTRPTTNPFSSPPSSSSSSRRSSKNSSSNNYTGVKPTTSCINSNKHGDCHQATQCPYSHTHLPIGEKFSVPSNRHRIGEYRRPNCKYTQPPIPQQQHLPEIIVPANASCLNHNLGSYRHGDTPPQCHPTGHQIERTLQSFPHLQNLPPGPLCYHKHSIPSPPHGSNASLK